jgi:hypothetical protein
MRSSDKRRGAIGPWAIIIMMALVLAFLVSVAPVSGGSAGKYCSDTCGKNIKSDDPEYGYTSWHEHKETKICTTRKGTKYLIQDRDCESGSYIKICHHRAYCDQTKACAETGEFVKITGKWKQCTKWEKYYETR